MASFPPSQRVALHPSEHGANVVVEVGVVENVVVAVVVPSPSTLLHSQSKHKRTQIVEVSVGQEVPASKPDTNSVRNFDYFVKDVSLEKTLCFTLLYQLGETLALHVELRTGLNIGRMVRGDRWGCLKHGLEAFDGCGRMKCVKLLSSITVLEQSQNFRTSWVLVDPVGDIQHLAVKHDFELLLWLFGRNSRCSCRCTNIVKVLKRGTHAHPVVADVVSKAMCLKQFLHPRRHDRMTELRH
mmetsp:Transcript_43258/g.84780  ORF Transcript_43258/g.84780 Transcript_43258/m.84780 type:complete len:241 (+) Transcript_43258:908-1630(+)